MPGEPTYFYYNQGQKVPLELVEDTVAVAFNGPIPARRLATLEESESPLAMAERSPALLDQAILLYRPAAAARGPAGLRAFAERLNRGPSVNFVAHVFRDQQTGLRLVPTDEIIARFKPGVTEQQIDALNAGYGVERVEQLAYAPSQYRLRVLNPAPLRTLEVANIYYLSDLVEWAEPNFMAEMRQSALELLPQQWHLQNTGQAGGLAQEDVRAQQAWAAINSQGDSNVVIAIVDGGVDPKHPGLKNNLVIANGCNFLDSDKPNDPTPQTFNSHGTSCAGIAVGAGGKISGVAPGCKVLPVKVILSGFNNFEAVAKALRFAAERAQIISNSWASPASDQISQALTEAMLSGRGGRGTIVLSGSGNDNGSMHPIARTSGVIVVGASTNVGFRAGYSNRGDAEDNPAKKQKRLSVVAPSSGTDISHAHGLSAIGPPDGSTAGIVTTDNSGTAGSNPPATGVTELVADIDYTGNFGGTSAACPLAAGVCALMLSVNADLTREQVKYLLEATADKIGTRQARVEVPKGTAGAGIPANYNLTSGNDPSYGFGRVNALQAVKAARGDAVRQIVRDAAGVPAYQDAIPVILRRVKGTNHFVSDDEIELVDARRDPEATNPPSTVRVRGAPGGFLRAAFQRTGGGPAISDELTIKR
jgi:subtilisin family serine protease